MNEILAEPKSHVATILAADAVGYSRAMSRDEAAALAALAASRRIIDSAVEAHSGRIFATAGDSVLAEFADGPAAVDCAVAIQRGLSAGADQVLVYRIGVHRGRVYADGDDLLGDAVNIAARLESMANAGGVFISGQVGEALGNWHGPEIEELGLQILRNIRNPVRVARLRLGRLEPEPGFGNGSSDWR
jgi:adenylate cyclase